MKIDDLMNKVGTWLEGKGKDSDIVISSRIRLARNLDNFVFLTLANEEQKKEIVGFIHNALVSAKIIPPMHYFSFKDLTSADKHLLLERHLISRDHAEAPNGVTGQNGSRALVINDKETSSIMINEEDHLRIQGLRSGFQLAELWDEINELDSRMEKHLPYAFSSQFGYLTACPTNVGTGLRFSVMVHLPALVLSKQIEKVFQALTRVKYTVRGFLGEGSQSMGDFYQISNLVTLGRAEKDILSEMENVIPEIIKYERTWREKLLNEQANQTKDRIWRAYGILKNAYTITSGETMELLSAVRMGINIGLIKDLTIAQVNEMFIFSQPAHLQRIAGEALGPEERDIFRASYFRGKLTKPSK
ncbi:MAG: protein arginine kinase [Planctomycetes bacterium]|nr:protein arginine kinase [Planctomycetota bacterium]